MSRICFGKQSYRLARCRDDVDVIITDSPLPLTIIYNSNPAIDNSLPKLVMDVYNTYNNINFFINRVKPYNPKGRNQTEEESDELSEKIVDLCNNYGIEYLTVDGSTRGYETIVKFVWNILQNLHPTKFPI